MVIIMPLSNKFIAILVKKIKQSLIDAHINKITMLSETDFLISKSKNCKEKLFISLNAHEPFITLCEENRIFSSLSNNFLLILKKELEDGRILALEKISSDRIIHMTITNTNDAYKKYIRHLYLELIPNQANMILTDNDNKIITLLRQSSFNKNIRLLLKGSTYIPPVSSSNSDFSKFEQEQNKLIHQEIFENIYNDLGVYSVIKTKTSKELSLNDLYNNYLTTMEENHRSNLHSKVTSVIFHQLKSLNKKLTSLQNELKATDKMEEYKLYGDLLLTYQDGIKIDYTQQVAEIDEYRFAFDPAKSIVENANSYYQKYAKIKRSIGHLQEQISVTKDKLSYFEMLKQQLLSCSDDDLKGLEFELIEKGFIRKKILKKQTNKTNGISQPYYYFVDNIKIGFGRNNYQNNYLTFTLAKPDFYFLHAKNAPGSHVIIFADNPSKQVIEVAASIAIINSKLSDGEVLITQKKNVKKINSFGKVSLNSYESIIIKQIDPLLEQKIKTLRKN